MHATVGRVYPLPTTAADGDDEEGRHARGSTRSLQQLCSHEPPQRANKLFFDSDDVWLQTNSVYPIKQVPVAIASANAWSELCLGQQQRKQINVYLPCFSSVGCNSW